MDSMGHSGGLALIWAKSMKENILGLNKHFIDVVVSKDLCGEWRFTGYYGSPNRNNRCEAWNLL